MTAWYALILAMALALVMAPPYLAYLRRWKVGQAIREEGPQSHHAKAGTPTMGGWVIVAPALIAALALAAAWGVLSRDVSVGALVILLYGGIGWLDDYLIIKRRKNTGLTARQKLLAQIAVACLFAGYLAASGHEPVVQVPVLHLSWDLGWLYYPFLVFTLASMTNAVNLTDGLDGLAGGTCIIALLGLGALLTYRSSADPGALVLALALVGGCMGFLWFNSHPAQVFMGDTGSLALGAALTVVAVLGHLELYLIPLGAVFVAEALSVVIQVTSFKLTKRRVFRMSPLHHHFELSGWPETKVVQRFYLIGGLCAAFTIALL